MAYGLKASSCHPLTSSVTNVETGGAVNGMTRVLQTTAGGVSTDLVLHVLYIMYQLILGAYEYF